MPTIPSGVKTADLSQTAKNIQQAFSPQAAQYYTEAPGSQGDSAVLGQRDFGPLRPLNPRTAPDSAEQRTGPRKFQYPAGVNIIASPRREYSESTPFEQLRNLAAAYDVAALCIATRIEEVQAMSWSVVAANKRDMAARATECEDVERFFRKPDGLMDFNAWVGALIRDHLVLDAATIFPHKDRGGGLFALELVDGATIKPLLDDRGRTLAYQQILYGYPFSQYKEPNADKPSEEFPIFTNAELLYRPRFTSTSSPYGSPPTEWIVLRVNQALRKQAEDLAYFSTGNIPNMLATFPSDNLSPEQIAEFQGWFDATMEGDAAARQKIHFIPYQADLKEIRPFSYDTALDQWMLQITCAAYAVPPQEIGFTMDSNRANAELQEAVNERRGLKPLAGWLKGIFDEVIRDWLTPKKNPAMISLPGAPTKPQTNGYNGLVWHWSFGDKTDKQTEASTYSTYIQDKVISADEVRTLVFSDVVDGPSPATLEAQAATAQAASEMLGDDTGGGSAPAGGGAMTSLNGAQITSNDAATNAAETQLRETLTSTLHELANTLTADNVYEALADSGVWDKFEKSVYNNARAILLQPAYLSARLIHRQLAEGTPVDLERVHKDAARAVSQQAQKISKTLTQQIQEKTESLSENWVSTARKSGRVSSLRKSIRSLVTEWDVKDTAITEVTRAWNLQVVNALSGLRLLRSPYTLMGKSAGAFFTKAYYEQGEIERVKQFIASKLQKDPSLTAADIIEMAHEHFYDYQLKRIPDSMLAAWVRDAKTEMSKPQKDARDAFQSISVTPPLHKHCQCKLEAVKIGDAYFAVWRAKGDDPCIRKWRTPFGNVDGCKGLNGRIVSAGALLGRNA